MLDLDLVLAILHHLFVFSLFAILFAEFVSVRPSMDVSAVRRIQAMDNWYGVLAALILIVGFSRAIFAAKGWDYYAHNAFFWAKIGTFVAIGRRKSTSPTVAEVAKMRPYLWTQVALFPLLPAFAAAMARGYGAF